MSNRTATQIAALVPDKFKPTSQQKSTKEQELAAHQYQEQQEQAQHYQSLMMQSHQYGRSQAHTGRTQTTPLIAKQSTVGVPQQQVQQPQQYQQQQQYQPPQMQNNYPIEYQPQEPMKTVKTQASVVHFDQSTVKKMCLIPFLGIVILFILSVLIWKMEHSSPSTHHSASAGHSTGIPHTAWTNTSENAHPVAQVYSVFYPYQITNFGEWEQIPSKGQDGIPGVTSDDFARLVSMHSCCKTQRNTFVCSNTNRIDGTAFDIRLIVERDQVYLEVYSVAKLLSGAACNLELEFSQS